MTACIACGHEIAEHGHRHGGCAHQESDGFLCSCRIREPPERVYSRAEVLAYGEAVRQVMRFDSVTVHGDAYLTWDPIDLAALLDDEEGT